MIKHYIKLAYKNVVKQKWLSAINIVGLGLGISLCLVIITIVKDQLSFDSFHQNSERIFRINTEAIRTNGDKEDYASSPFVIGNEVNGKFPFMEKVVRLSQLNTEIGQENNLFHSSGFFADLEFFQVFGFELLYGNKATALANPYSVILTENTALKIFAQDNPVGKTIVLKGMGNFTVTGVMKNPPGKTHLQFDMLAASSTMPALETQGVIVPVSGAWKNYYSSYLYVLLKSKTYKSQFENDLNAIAAKQYSTLTLQTGDKGFHFYLQDLNKIVPGPMLSNNMGKALPEQALWMLGIFALVIIISAAFNYASLSVASSLRKAKEIGIRKTSGAMRYQLVIQFLTETIFTTLVSLILASILFHYFLKPLFESLAVAKDFDIDLNESASLYFYFLLFTLLIGLLAGFVPALYLSAIKPSRVLKNFDAGTISPKLTFRKILLGAQFTFALVFAITLINLSRQLNYVVNAEYGFNKDNIINIDLQGNDYATARQAFAAYNGVLDVSGISHSLGTFRDRRVDVRVNEEDEQSRVMDYTIDTGYINNLGLHLIAGKNFSGDLPKDRELFVIVNEAFLRTFHLGNAAQAIGKNVILNAGDNVTISGVLKDFHFKPFTYDILPLVFRYNPLDITQLNIKVSGTNPAATIAGLDKTWKSFDNEHAFSYKYFSDELKDTYAQYKDVATLMGIVSVMSVTIAFLGLVALVFFMLQQKIKEISIRKVLGATIMQLYALLSIGFLRLLIITVLLAVPISVFLNNLLMQQFAYKINQAGSYFAGILAVLFIAFMALAIQVWEAAIANPVRSLKME